MYDSPGQDPPLTRELLGRMSSTLLILSSPVAMATLVLPATTPINRLGVFMVALVSLIIGCGAWFAPWQRWPRSALLGLGYIGLVLIALFNHFNGADPLRFGGFFVLAFAAIGIAHPPGTSLRMTPALVLAYLLPLATTGNLTAATAASLLYAVPVCLLVGEALAWVTARLGHTQQTMHQSETRYRSLVQHASDITIIVDDRGLIQYTSPSVTRILGYLPTELLGTEGLALAHPDDVQQVRQSMAGIISMPQATMALASRLRHKDGNWHVIEGVITNLLDEPSVAGMVVNCRDVTERAKAETALRASEVYYRALIEQTSDIIVVLNHDGTVRYASPAQERVLGYPAGDLVTDSPFAMVHPDDTPFLEHSLARLYSEPGSTFSTEQRVRHSDGSWRVLETTATNRIDDPAINGIVINAHDITDRKHMAEQLSHDALHDALTGLPNRILFFDRLGQALDRHRRNPERCYALLFLDLDRFKTINDSLGHMTGDALLMAVGSRLEQAIRPADTVARLGGDEFAILLEDVEQPDGALVVAERILHNLAQPFHIGEHEVFTTASIGITLGDERYEEPADLLRDADIAMYRAKHAGKARHAVFDPAMHASMVGRLRLEEELRHAVEQAEFEVQYQPVVAVANGTILGVEALARWRHPQRGLILPEEFMLIAEETGLISALGEWVLRTACAQARQWHLAGLPLYVAVNLSASQFRQRDISATVAQIVRETGFDPRYLELELTESILMEDASATITALAELQAIGVQGISMDDFGTGYSSLSYLQRFPITTVKIDRSFVQDVTTNPNNAAIVISIIALAHSLGLTTVGEGVETPEQLAFLRAHGCDRIQGYLISGPIPPSALTSFVETSFSPHTPAVDVAPITAPVRLEPSPPLEADLH